MEDLARYTFDPDHPKDFLAYKLLLKILKDRNNYVIIDPFFIAEIFDKDIFDEEITDEIWDKPNNFNDLSGIQKANSYISNYSFKELNEAILKKIGDRNQHSFKNLIDTLLTSIEFVDNSPWPPGININDNLLSNDYLEMINTGNYHQLELLNKTISHNKNLIFFLTKPYDKIIKFFDIHKTAILITTVENFSVFQNILPKNMRPILLKNTKHLHRLLDFVKRDLNIQNAKTQNTQQKDIYYLNYVEIKNYFSIENISLENLSDKKEIYFLGENGDGKTILLQAILLALKGNRNEGDVIKFIKHNPMGDPLLSAVDSNSKSYLFKENPKEQEESYENIFAYGVSRFRNDSDKKDQEGYLTIFSYDQYLDNPVKWLQHLDHKELSGEAITITLAKAKELLKELLDKNVEIEVTPDKVIFTEKGTPLLFDQLSDGYKSVIVWVCDMVIRLSARQPDVADITDFKGIVLVDEIGIFLHPKWQYTIARKLREWFPGIQFIFTTHSPLTIMGASKDAVFYKLYKENGVTKVTEPMNSISHLMANGVITSPLFNLPDARTFSFDEANEDLDTSDDYLSGRIHRIISKRIREEYNVTEDDIIKFINEELDKLETE
ncbi:MAG: AAA family ATPase [bacterium]|nr:AAA family ATPase [bacterium]